MASSTTSLARHLVPFAGPLSLLAVALFGVTIPFAVAMSVPSEPMVEKQPATIDVRMAARGHEVFATTCIACHGADARGLANLGKDLTSGFASQADDTSLVAMIMRGRQPGEPGHTAALPMPPKGGRADLMRTDIQDVVAYLRSLQNPSRLTEPLPPLELPAVASGPTPAASEKPANPVASEPTSSSKAPSSVVMQANFNPEAAARGKRVFNSCIACHGKNGNGMPNLGADLVHSTFVMNKSDPELIAFIKKGRMPTDPETRLKLTMPPKGGNPALKDEQIADVVAYIRSLQVAETASR